ncbi:hypothetical protein D9613_009340 [Agrocybe pediades]|uniref:Uncharacterized protein n=1 Tax=Agrocybe pediades TaxID=84607 RepID=A0A8H4VTG9_9AGAR|nr:hypothetical protein D9613_009340 [Agrocybe pediades]
MQFSRVFVVLLPFLTIALGLPTNADTGFSGRHFTYEPDMIAERREEFTDDVQSHYGGRREEFTDDIQSHYGGKREEFTDDIQSHYGGKREEFTDDVQSHYGGRREEFIDDVQSNYIRK